MTPRLVQEGSGPKRDLVVVYFLGGMFDAAIREAAPRACVVNVTPGPYSLAKGLPPLPETVVWAQRKTGALMTRTIGAGWSQGCGGWKSQLAAGHVPDALACADGLHSTLPTSNLGHLRTFVERAKRGHCAFVASASRLVYVEQLKPPAGPYASVVRVLREVTGWPLDEWGDGTRPVVRADGLAEAWIEASGSVDRDAHVRHARVHLPAMLRRAIELLDRRDGRADPRADTDPAPPPSGQSLGARALAWSLGEMKLRPAPSAVRRAEYFAPCVREVKGTLRSLGLQDGNWCAAGACYATRQVTQDGDVVPHLYRASGIELERDATRAGHWLPATDVREGRAAPKTGDLVILHRGDPGAWTRHVGRVAGPIGVGGTFTCVDANGPGWRMVDRQLSSQRLRGFVRYPQDRERLGPGRTDPELDRLLALAQAQAVGLDWDSWGEERDS